MLGQAVQMERLDRTAVAEVQWMPSVAVPDLEALRLAYPPPGCFYPKCARAFCVYLSAC